MLEEMNRTRLAAHIRHLAATPATVGFEFLRVVFGEFVLESTRQSNVARHRPSFLTSGERAEGREFIRHILHLITVRRAHNQHVINHFRRDTIRDSHYTVRTGDCHYFGAEFNGFFRCAPSYVSEAGEGYFLAFDIFARRMEKMLGEIESTETGSFRTED